MQTAREKKIIKTSVIGIIVNVMLVGFKMAVGLLANSIAIILDAVNNLSDALSSLITIIGTKLASKAPDKKHPFGHGRIEYITSIIISVIVLLAGFTSIKESIEKIINPEATNYSIYSIIVISAAIITKFIIGKYVKGVGVKLNSQSLIASGSDAFFDAVLSFATLVGAVINMIWGLQLEGILGVAISVIIIKAGVEMLGESLSSIIGRRADSETTDKIKELIGAYDEVNGVYDLTLHNYGPTKIIGTVHVEVDDNMTAREIHDLTRKITEDIFVEFNIILTVGIYASNSSAETERFKEIVNTEIKKHPEVIQMHGLYIDEKRKLVSFDIIVEFKQNAQKIRGEIIEALKKELPGYEIYIILDTDFSE